MSANACIASTITERAAWLSLAVRVRCTRLNALDSWRANISTAASGQAFEAVLTVIVSLLLAFVADGARDAPALAAAECAAIAVSVVLARGANHVDDVFN